ncbi:MAG: hypothetical protein JW932_12400 [Deltaproteobacteria bacterium]|nr:hypothetical protein [Deltaproteobacteria bacterium]
MEMIICFIDDSDFEHELVREEIAPQKPDIQFVQAYTFEEAKRLLGKKIPLLFLLDLWGQDQEVSIPYLTPKRELEEMISEFPTLESVYEDLDDYPGDRTNEFLKRLFRIVDNWRNAFEEVCARIGQNRKYGLANLSKVRNHFPGVSAVFYTRKSLISDAIALFKAGADGLFKKPSGNNDIETHALTKGYAPELMQDLFTIIDRNIHQLMASKTFYRDKMGLDVDILISTWKEFINK